MSDTVNFEITIPSDDDGYILLQCEHCGNLFKCTATDIEDDSILNIYCPSCGLISENYLTEDVIELAMTKAENYAMNMIYNAFKDLEFKNKRNNGVNFKAGKKPELKYENLIYSSIEALRVNYYPCCNRNAKISLLLKMSASYCPFCGGYILQMSRNELKKTIYKFNSVSNRLLQSDYSEYKKDLRKFIEYIDNTEIIKKFVGSCGKCEWDMNKEFDEIANSYFDCIFSIGNTDSEEVSDVYAILKYMCMEYKGYVTNVMLGYSDSTKYNDMIKNFNHKVVMVLIRHIGTYLTEVGIGMGLDENIIYNINGTQVNLATDNANINATQNNNGLLNADEFKNLVSAMRDSLNCDLTDEDKADANESIDVISSELASGNPNEETVKTRFKLLKRLDPGVKFASACCSLLTFADKIYPFLEPIKNWFQSII